MIQCIFFYHTIRKRRQSVYSEIRPGKTTGLLPRNRLCHNGLVPETNMVPNETKFSETPGISFCTNINY